MENTIFSYMARILISPPTISQDSEVPTRFIFQRDIPCSAKWKHLPGYSLGWLVGMNQLHHSKHSLAYLQHSAFQTRHYRGMLRCCRSLDGKWVSSLWL